MSGHHPFNELTKDFPPERRRRIDDMTRELLTEMPQHELRRVRALTQRDMAKMLRVNQPAVSKLEQQIDMYVSSFRSYIEAAGGQLKIVAEFPRMRSHSPTSPAREKLRTTQLDFVQSRAEEPGCLPGQTQKSVSGQCGGQDPGLASDAVAQQSDGHVRFEFPLNRAQHVQGGPAQDGHDGGRVAAAHAAVVPPGTARPGCGAGRSPPPSGRARGPAGPPPSGGGRDAVAHGTLPAAGAVALRLHADQAAQAGPLFGVRDLFAKAGAAQHGADAPFAAAAVALDGLATVLCPGRADAPLGLVEGRLHLPVEGALVALDRQHVVGVGRPQGLHDGPLAAGGVDRDHGPFQVDAVEQTGDGRDLVALGVARLLGQRQPLPHQVGARHVQGPEAVGKVARAARDLAVQSQDQLPGPGTLVPSSSPQGGPSRPSPGPAGAPGADGCRGRGWSRPGAATAGTRPGGRA